MDFRSPTMELGGDRGFGLKAGIDQIFGQGAKDAIRAGIDRGNQVRMPARELPDPVEQVGPESSLQYEGSIRYRDRNWRTELSVFVNEVHDNIQKQALILPQGAVLRC